ncbi:MAG: flavodoxin domain-containing protein [Zetaproteobacteria bacterium]|nr:flavodoxin domain-containing protein [Zetaproteobacteria bacterium]
MRILIVFQSDYGHTKSMAESIAAGAKAVAPESEIVLQIAEQTSNEDLEHADVLFFGTPVHMGSMAWSMKKLVDQGAKLWMENRLEGKVGGVFVTGGGFGDAGGGVETTMIGLHANFLEHGMMVVGFPKSLPGYADGGLQWGAYARCATHEGMPKELSATQQVGARSYGAHVVEVAQKLFA